jgi:hypothetical protein
MSIQSLLIRALVATTLGLLINSPSARAQVICKSEITYSWKRGNDPESTIYFSSLDESAATEELAKAALTARIPREKLRASEACRKLHENLSGCIATKLQTGGSFSELSFSARKAVEEAAKRDCDGTSGKCTAISSSTPTCIAPAGAAGASGATGEAPAKGKEKKK